MNNDSNKLDKESDLTGFKEVMDLKESSFIDKRIKEEDHILTNHLINELERLNKIYDFFSKKIEMKIKFSNTNALIEEQSKENNYLKKDICERLTKKDSPIQKRLSIWWESTF
tara:strand:+ start:122 stop:460 length:339 start_codon:yes stop_codon:yes gene_type:complete